MKHEKTDAHFPLNPSAEPVMDQPETVPELLRKYGTYNVQPTSETVNPYPAIAAGRIPGKANPQKAPKDPDRAE